MNRYSIRLGSTILAFNAVLLAGVAFIFNLEATLDALFFIFASSRMVDLVLAGLSQRKLVLIISVSWQEIEEVIL